MTKIQTNIAMYQNTDEYSNVPNTCLISIRVMTHCVKVNFSLSSILSPSRTVGETVGAKVHSR